MSEELLKLIEKARLIPSSAASGEAQRRSFAYGNTHFENSRITREMIDLAADELKSEAERRAHERG